MAVRSLVDHMASDKALAMTKKSLTIIGQAEPFGKVLQVLPKPVVLIDTLFTMCEERLI